MNSRLKLWLLCCSILILILETSFILFSYKPTHSSYPSIQVCFTPGENCTNQIVDAVSKAKSLLYIQAYSFTSKPIAQAIIEAKKRGVDVKVILDKSQLTQKYSSMHFFNNYSIPTWIDHTVAIAHNKVMIIDDSIVITGSFNFTQAAQNRNAENLLIIKDKELAQRYKENWMERFYVSIPAHLNN